MNTVIAVFFVLVVAVIVRAMWQSVKQDQLKAHKKAVKTLSAAPAGSEKIEYCKIGLHQEQIARYAEAGWTVMDQSSSKSFLSAPSITIRFRKDK